MSLKITKSPKQRKPCGNCTLCCTVLPVDAQGKLPDMPAGITCQHCTARGCAIHQIREQVCRDFLCLYAIGETIFKPTDTGVVWMVREVNGQKVLSGFCADLEETLASELVRHTIQRYINYNRYQVVSIQDSKHVISHDMTLDRKGKPRNLTFVHSLKQSGLKNELLAELSAKRGIHFNFTNHESTIQKN